MRYLFLFCSVFASVHLFSQTNTVYVGSISIEGNKKTRDFVIEKEMTVTEGQSIFVIDLLNVLGLQEQRVYNTGLFNKVNVKVSEWENDTIDITCSVVERWYHLGRPEFDFVDRNFNVWLTEFNADLSRVTYGLEYLGRNTTGRNEQLDIEVHGGYRQEVLVRYLLPYINEKSNLGLRFDGFYSRQREVDYATDANKELFKRFDDFSYKNFTIGGWLIHRPNTTIQHEMGLYFTAEQAADSVLLLNPNFFSSGNTQSRALSLRYTFSYDRRDLRSYPLRGDLFTLELEKVGVNIFDDVDIFNAYLSYSHFRQLSKNLFVAGLARVKLSTPFHQPYHIQEDLGHDYYVRGYELYLMNGPYHGLIQSELKYRILDFEVNSSAILKSDKINRVPFTFFVKAFADAGYTSGPAINSNPFNNELLYSGGLGLDILFFYDFTARIEYAVARFNGVKGKNFANGLFLHRAAALEWEPRLR